MQLSEMEEEMDQRIHAAERKTREQVGRTLSVPRHDFEDLVWNNPGSFLLIECVCVFVCVGGCICSVLPSCQTNKS